jgi:hypothetical protein
MHRLWTFDESAGWGQVPWGEPTSGPLVEVSRGNTNEMLAILGYELSPSHEWGAGTVHVAFHEAQDKAREEWLAILTMGYRYNLVRIHGLPSFLRLIGEVLPTLSAADGYSQRRPGRLSEEDCQELAAQAWAKEYER